MQVGLLEAQATLVTRGFQAPEDPKSPKGAQEAAGTHKDPRGPKGVQGAAEEAALDRPQQVMELEPPLAEERGVTAQAPLLFEELEAVAQGPPLVTDRGEMVRVSLRAEEAQAFPRGVGVVEAGPRVPRGLHLGHLVHRAPLAHQGRRSAACSAPRHKCPDSGTFGERQCGPGGQGRSTGSG